MIEKLDWVLGRYEELAMQLSQPDVAADQDRWRKLMREHAQLEPLAQAALAHEQLAGHLAQARELLTLPDMAEMAREEVIALEEAIAQKEREIQLLLLPRDPNDERNVVLEVRAGAGGDEAGLFGAVLMRMYTRYAERRGWRTELLSDNITELGGVKEVVLTIIGQGAYSRLKYESGVHRVQRVPATESQGRIHTSTVTVAVLPEVEEVEVEISAGDLRIDTYRASGSGGQHVNRTDSAVRITHIPTGLVVTCQDEKSQIKNKEKAMRVLRARLYDLKQSQQNESYAQHRRAQVGTGDRSERIRTYNFPQGRVTDHRIGLTLYKIDAFIDGDCDEVIDALTFAEQSEQLKQLNRG
ncbi:MAG: peptide chain release factor 1 [Oscillospiraceae bacterium]|jgi:peptide chain release factor 1|nr:peptide chain release factor 1 [Oscillospiraceae bacterium]